jgi:hypothetical protein
MKKRRKNKRQKMTAAILGQHVLRLIFSFLGVADRDTVYRVCKEWRGQYRWVHPLSGYLRALADGNTRLAHELFHSQNSAESLFTSAFNRVSVVSSGTAGHHSPVIISTGFNNVINVLSGNNAPIVPPTYYFGLRPVASQYFEIALAYCDVDTIVFVLQAAKDDNCRCRVAVDCALRCALDNSSTLLLQALTKEFGSTYLWSNTSPSPMQFVSKKVCCAQLLQFLIDDSVACDHLRRDLAIIGSSIREFVEKGHVESILVLLRAFGDDLCAIQHHYVSEKLFLDLIKRDGMVRAVEFMLNNCSLEYYLLQRQSWNFLGGTSEIVLVLNSLAQRLSDSSFHPPWINIGTYAQQRAQLIEEKTQILKLLLANKHFYIHDMSFKVLSAAVDCKAPEIVAVVLQCQTIVPEQAHLKRALAHRSTDIAEMLLVAHERRLLRANDHLQVD